MLSETTIEKFKTNLRGELIQRSDGRYEDARKLYNGMIDKRPLLIARCVDVADVITAVNFGRDLDLLIAIRGGGHNGPGFGSCDDGLVIDRSMMKSGRVDPATGSLFHPAYTVPLTQTKGTVNVPVSSLQGGGIYGIVFPSLLYKGLHRFRRDQLHAVPKAGQHAGPVMGGATGFHDDRTGRLLLKERDQIVPP